MKPQITIKHGKLLEPFFKTFIETKYPGFLFLTEQEIKEKIILFRSEWLKYEDKFLTGLKEIGLEFFRNKIDVLIVSATDRDMSSPLIIRSRYDEKEFINVLFHELLHNLFNDIGLKRQYTEEVDRTVSHIYVFAVLVYLFKDVLNEPERIDIEKAKSSPDKNMEYYKAWQIVDRDGYINIIKNIVKK